MRRMVLLLIPALALLAAGCFEIDRASLLESPGESPTVTTPADTPGVGHPTATTTAPAAPGPVGSPAYLDSVEILLLESYPVQVRVRIEGALPTPCHRLAWDLRAPDTRGRITLHVHSTADPAVACIQVLQPFEQVIDVGSFTDGSYVLVVNGVEYPFAI